MAANDKPWIGTLYYYLISAITVVIMIYGGITGLLGVYKMIDPVGNLNSYEYERYANLDNFRDYYPRERPVLKPTTPDTVATQGTEISEAEIEERWQRFRDTAVESQQREGRRELILMAIIYIICLPIFLVHWRYARRSGAPATQ